MPGARIETLVLAPGFWRPTHAGLDLRECPLGSGCVGGVSAGNEGQGVCNNATTGPYCAVCARRYKRQGGTCVSCEEFEGIAAAPLLVLLGVGILLALLVSLVYKRDTLLVESARGVALASMTDAPSSSGHGRVVEKFKIAYAFVQAVLSSFMEFKLKFPPAFSAIASAFSVVNLDIFDFLSMGCIVEVDFYGELVTTCTVPVVLAVFLLGYARHRAKVEKEKRTARQIFTRLFLVLIFCVYPGVTRKIFTTFKCERFVTAGLDEAGCHAKGYAWFGDTCYRRYLGADLSISCDASEYSGWKAFAVLLALAYPFGMPLLFAWLLRQDKDDASLSFIRAAYEERFYWWEVVELGRKLLLILLLVFFFEGSASQILATLLVAFGFTLVLMRHKPYKSDDDDILAAFAQALLMMTSLASLCLKVDVAGEDAWSAGWFDLLLTVLVASVPGIAMIEVLIAAGMFQCHRVWKWRFRQRTDHSASNNTAVAPLGQHGEMNTDTRIVIATPREPSTSPDTKSKRSQPAVAPVLSDTTTDKPQGGHLDPNIDMVESMLTKMANNKALDRALDEGLRARIKLAIADLRGEDPPRAPLPQPPRMSVTPGLDATLNTKFHAFVTRAAIVEDPVRRASALGKAHAIYDEAEAARRARLAILRREQNARLKKRKEESWKRRYADEETSTPPKVSTGEIRPPAPTDVA